MILLNAKPAKLCRACGHSKVNRARGLCWVCYYTPGMRDRFPSTSKYGRRGEGRLIGRRAVPLPIPTNALPGTPEKIAALATRAAAGEALWHPNDARRK